MGIAPNGVLAALSAALNGQPMERPADVEQHDRRALNLLEMRRHRLPIDLDPIRTQVHSHSAAVHIDEVLQASSGVSSHTTSTCAVCGNMSYARSELTR